MTASLVLAAHAATIVPVAWKQSNSFSSQRMATNLSNALGMDGTQTILYNLDGSLSSEPTSANGVSWVTTSNGNEATAAAAGRVWIVADLGASYNLGTINLWNFQWNHPTAGDLSNRGASQFDILVRNTGADTDDGTLGGSPINLDNPNDNVTIDNDVVFNLGTFSPWQEVLSDQPLTQAPNDDTYTGESFDLTGNTARFVAIRVDSYYLGNGIGLGKVRINGTVVAPTGGWAINGGGSFNVAAHWSDKVVPTSAARFGDALTAPNAPASITLDSPVSLEQVEFENFNTYSLAGPSTLTLTGGARVNASAGTHYITAPIAGSAGVTKTGPGTVVLGNPANSYTGNTTVSNGVLAVTALGAINPLSGRINIAAGAFALAGDGAGNGASGTLTAVFQGAGQFVADSSLTTEVITLGSANPGYTGQVVIRGGTVKVGNTGALGNTTGSTLITGGSTDIGALWLDGITITGETLEFNARQGTAANAPHLISTGTGQWAGPIQGNTGGANYNIKSQSGLLTLAGNFDLPDGGLAGDPAIPINAQVGRFINLSGDGGVRIEGQIIDVSGPADGGNVSLTKVGAGTVTIATVPTATVGEGYHQGRTVIDGGTLAVEMTGNNEGELFSRTIEVASGATFNISSFTTYNLQVLDSGLGQIISGAGTVNLGGPGRTLGLFSDSTISPGDTPNHQQGEANQDVHNGLRAAGTLTINGDVSSSGATFEMEIAENGANDAVVISGTATLAATINVTGMPVPVTNGTVFTLISAAGGITDNGITFGTLPTPNYTPDITATAVRLIWNDNTAPTVVALNPNGGTANVFPKTSLRISFDEAMLKGVGNIAIHRTSDNAVVDTIAVTSSNVVVAGAKVTVVPSVQLNDLTSYYVNIPSGVFSDLTGNPYVGIANATTWAFTTGTQTPREPVLVDHRFTDGGGALNATPADFFNAVVTAAGGSNSWGAGAAFLDSGTVSVDAGQNAAYLNLGSYINGAKGSAAGKFKLTMTISPTTGFWISLGFATQKTPNTARNFTDFGSGAAGTTTGIGTILYRATDATPTADALACFGGTGNANGLGNITDITGNRTLTVTLDLTPAGGYNGTSNFGRVTWSDSILGTLTDYTYTSARDFGSILISEANSSGGAVSGLTLTQILPPTLQISPRGGNLDFKWSSLAGKQYDLVATNSLTAPSATWPPYNDGVTTYTNIPAAGTGLNVLTNVVKIGPAKFFILIEKP
jgi:autotransporter-associated beta strand protein